MNYHDIQFYIASDSRARSTEIAKLLNRKENTFLATMDITEFYAYLKKCTEFTCFIFQISNNIFKIENIVNSIAQKNPNFPVILISVVPISVEKYRNFINLGVANVLEWDSEADSEKLVENLSKIIDIKWKAYQFNKEQNEKIYKATVVSLNHEINQPLTVILNAIGLLGAELKSVINKEPKVKSHFEFISRSTKRIQLILEKLKRINEVRLIEYTTGVPMINLEKEESPVPSLNKIKINNKDTIILVGQSLAEQPLIENEIKKMGLDIITTQNLEDAKDVMNRIFYKIQAIMLSDNLPTHELENTLNDLNKRKDSVPVILVKSNQPSKENSEFVNSSSFQILNRPITVKNLQSAISKTVLMTN